MRTRAGATPTAELWLIPFSRIMPATRAGRWDRGGWPEPGAGTVGAVLVPHERILPLRIGMARRAPAPETGYPVSNHPESGCFPCGGVRRACGLFRTARSLAAQRISACAAVCGVRISFSALTCVRCRAAACGFFRTGKPTAAQWISACGAACGVRISFLSLLRACGRVRPACGVFPHG